MTTNRILYPWVALVTMFLTGSLPFLMSACFDNPSPAVVITNDYTLDEFNQVTLFATIQSDGGSDIFEEGFCFSQQPNPTVAEGRLIAGINEKEFSALLPLPEGNYYARAYAVNGAGIAYGNSINFTILPPPYLSMTIVDVGDITGSSAFFRGRIESNQNILARGICWNIQPDPTISHAYKESGSGTGIFELTITGLTPGTTYYARPFAHTDAQVEYGSQVMFQTVNMPLVLTQTLRNTGTFILSTGGEILASFGLATQAGVCWSTQVNPTVNDQKTDDQIVYTTFYSDPPGLQPGVTYYIRAYAVNVAGVGYGNPWEITMPAASVTDIDGNAYSSVTIGTQIWLTENLKTTRFANGDPIPRVTEFTSWKSITTPAWDYPVSDAKYDHPYGKLYNWYAVTDPRNVCPAGWHVPSDPEWQALIDFLGGNEVAGSKLREEGVAHWKAGNYGATNLSRFTALPAGAISAEIGIAYPLHSLGLFWTPLSVTTAEAKGYYLFDAYQSINNLTYVKQTGMSVRCIKD